MKFKAAVIAIKFLLKMLPIQQLNYSYQSQSEISH